MIKKKTNIRNKKEIGRRLKKLRQELELTQKELGEMIGYSDAYISEIEKGKKSPSPEFFYLAAKVCLVNPGWLIAGKGQKFFVERKTSDSENFIADYSNELQLMLWRMNLSPFYNDLIIKKASSIYDLYKKEIESDISIQSNSILEKDKKKEDE